MKFSQITQRVDNRFKQRLVPLFHFYSDIYYTLPLLPGLIESNDCNRIYLNDARFKSYICNLPSGSYKITSTDPISIFRQVIDGEYTTINVLDVVEYEFTTETNGQVGLSFRKADNTEWDESIIVRVKKIK